jgi:hypothetical protein
MPFDLAEWSVKDSRGSMLVPSSGPPAANARCRVSFVSCGHEAPPQGGNPRIIPIRDVRDELLNLPDAHRVGREGQ